MGTVTQVLNQSSLSEALNDKRLQGILYQELKVIAHGKIGQQADKEINTTSLVHDAFIKINKHEDKDIKWASRKHFYATAALAMKQILVDQARNKLAIKRGTEINQATFNEGQIKAEKDCHELIALNDALFDLEKINKGLVELVHFKYCVGLPGSEIAEILQVSKKTVDREWNKAKSLIKFMIEAKK